MTAEITGSVVEVAVTGDIQPNAELHINLKVLSGTQPAAIRLWVGTRLGEGSLNTKADATDDGWHAHVECPATIPAATELWVELETPTGERVAHGFSVE